MFYKKNLSKRDSALLISISLLFMTVIAGFAYGFIHSQLVDISNPNVTVENIQKSTGLFRLEIFLWSIIILLDIFVAWGIFHYFNKESSILSHFTSWLRIFYVIFLIIGTLNLFVILPELNSDKLYYENITKLLSNFDKYWGLGLIVFGIHLVFLGILVLKTLNNKLIGILLIIAGLSYFVVHILYSFYPQLNEMAQLIEKIFIIPMTLGELGFAIWILIRGGR